METELKRLAHLVRANFIIKSACLAKDSGGMNVRETADFVRVDSGLPSDTFNNSVWLKEQVKPSDTGLIEETVEYFNKKQYPMALWSWEDRNSCTFETLRSVGLNEAETNVAMYADLDALRPDPNGPAELRRKEAATAREIEQYGDALASLFGESAEAANVRLYYKRAASRLLNHSVMKLYIGSVRDEVVATGCLIFAPDSVGIYDIATRQEYRGRGFGSAMFHFLLAEARKHRAGWCVLQASPDGINIYKRAGFEPVCEVTVYENRHLLE
ncbi:GNAT family N-acetyltransferase [Paenibacillus ehimensis]|uniref:GNAT family N-acetyltransferase n=1 Tax=Paenibacillus ehimensis TaxID=79264 RepID=A0ABT8VH77_9BACL|nr:GNAT family N-acetyltransferase [Paenibacillus ehimensis]MDO3680337.1 GNAT family N-acetyltransferase [Paenibacillus ehimensis]MEC0211399.1 GNAT family N-acetyltransferase [Paenibacillus ehimensis]